MTIQLSSYKFTFQIHLIRYPPPLLIPIKRMKLVICLLWLKIKQHHCKFIVCILEMENNILIEWMVQITVTNKMYQTDIKNPTWHLRSIMQWIVTGSWWESCNKIKVLIMMIMYQCYLTMACMNVLFNQEPLEMA